MRLLIGIPFAAVLLAQSGAPVEGVVTSGLTHTGLAGVGVTVESTSGRHITYTTTSNADGSFRIGSIGQDGEYKASFVKAGYRSLPPGHPSLSPFHLAAATGTVRLQVELSPYAQFRGRVLDADGRPAPQARVELLGPEGTWVVTVAAGKDGSFVYQNSLPTPGFVMRAIPLKELPAPEPADGEPQVWAPTYYPHGTDRSQAANIVWRGEVDLDGYDIKLVSTPVFHVRGTVVDDTGKPVEGALVKAAPAERLTILAPVEGDAATTTGPDGVFDLSGVRPGDWTVAADWKRAGQALSGFASGTVSRGDWEGARIKVEMPFSVKGVVEAPDEEGARPSGSVMLIPENHSGSRQLIMGLPDGPNGRFEIPGVHAGRYQIVTTGPETGVYLDSVRLGSQEVLGQTVDIVDDTLPIHVIYKGGGGRVQGMVEHCGEVVLIPKDPAWQNEQFFRTAQCQSGGRFAMDAIRPGDYYAAAYDRPPAVMDASFLSEMVATGESVRVEAGQSTLVTLKLTALPEQ
jgi:hypothetical protein